jgi:hypothetical protein
MKKIIFRPSSKLAENVVEKPKPSKFYFPQWYKDIPKFDNNKMKIDSNGQANLTMKSCMPFFDTFMTGYIQETWCDIYIDDNENDADWKYSSQPPIIEERFSFHKYPLIDGFSEKEFSWRQPWIPQLPNGYSMLYTHPFNRFDLPFLSLSGIVDNDNFYMEPIGNHPFFIRKGFKGIIPRGTPMFQMIPIKRDFWVSKFFSYNEDLVQKFFNVRQFFYDGYKKMYWQKKNYS